MTFIPSWDMIEGRSHIGDMDADILPCFLCSWWAAEHGCPFCATEYVVECGRTEPKGIAKFKAWCAVGT